MTQFPTSRSTRQCSTASWHLPALRPLLAMMLAAAPAAWASTTDISTSPLVTLQSGHAKPNLLFVMDSSGSMNWSYMPDNLGVSSSITNQPYDGHGGRANWYGYWSAQCNGIAFDPTADYSPPRRANGTFYPNVAFTAAPVDGYAYDLDNTKPVTNLSTSSDSYYYQYSGTQPAMSWTYNSGGVVSNQFYTECSGSTSTSSPVFTKVSLSSASATVQQSYANWYSYYSRRYLLMRTAMGRAIYTLDSNYRVGFSTIYDTQAKDGTNYFVDVKDFDDTQKAKFYSSLYTVVPSGGTNLPDALSEAGRYYAKKISTQTSDPVQYACQRNYTLLSTDGYWNTNSADYALDGSTRVGEQDDTEKRPMKDGSGDKSTSTATPYSAPVTADYTSSTQTRTVGWTRKAITGTAGTVPGGTTSVSGGCTNSLYTLYTTTTYVATETQTQMSVAPHRGTSAYTQTVAATNGVTTSTSSTTPTTTWNSLGTAVWTYTDTSTASPANTTPVDPTTGWTVSGTPSKSCKSTGTLTIGNTDTITSGPTSWSPSFTYADQNIVIGSYTAGTPTVSVTATFSASSNTLADVAEYYYKTDLRTTALGNCSVTYADGSTGDVCSNIVQPTTSLPVDPATWQHMNTFTIGLGTSGTLTYDKNYLTQKTGTYVDLTSGLAVWPAASTSGNALNIDDLWHAAVNGRGQYYSALNASLLAEAIANVVNLVQQQSGSGASAATSALQLVTGDNNLIFLANYTTSSWTGDLLAYGLNGDTLAVDVTPKWSAQGLLDSTMSGVTTSPRKIYFNNGAATPALSLMTWSNLSTAQKTYFSNVCPTTPATAGVTARATLLAQCSTLTGADLTAANNGSNLLDYLSGVRTYESAVSGTTTAPLYRKRDHVLGDIVDAAPVYVGKPPFKYSDAGYADFVTAQASRKPVIYAAANDGMLHAFSAAASGDGGSELWAFVPTPMLPNLYLLADTAYSSKHRFFVDGTPVMGDIKVGSTWKTIVVGGFGGGGKGYYALDITDPLTPKLLWEFSDANLGLSYGNPVITKRVDGTWVVVFGSGYNNADGLGHLFVVNAQTGAKLLPEIVTPAGTVNPAGPTNPSGLSKINAWIESDSDNTAKRFYGGDLLGNLWRFDIDSQVAPFNSAMQLAQFVLSDGTPQPITTRPVPIAVPLASGNRAVVIVGTGKYLGTNDITDTKQQSIYAVADDLGTTGWGDVRAGANKDKFVKQTLTVDAATSTASDTNTSVDMTNLSVAGWWLDLPNAGERIIVNMLVINNVLVAGSAIPTADVCISGGKSWRYLLNATSGAAPSTTPPGSLWSGSAMMVGESAVLDANGNEHLLAISSKGEVKPDNGPPPPLPPGLQGHRTSWRELSN